MASTTDLVTQSVPDLTKDSNQNDTKEEKSFKSMTMRERCAFVKEVITVEPLVACYMIAALLSRQALINLEYEKACKANWQFNDTVCDDIVNGEGNNFPKEVNDVQSKITELHSWIQVVQNIIPIILVLFLGSYSDRHKIRKPFLLIPLFGELFSVVGCILCAHFLREWSVEVLGVMQVVIPSLFGGQTMILMTVFAYIADVSTLEMRTLRIGVLQIVLNIVNPVVQSFSGILFKKIGYIWIFLLVGVCFIVGILYGIFYIKEPKQPVDIKNKVNLIKDMFDPHNALETIRLLTKTSQGNQRLNIILVMVILFIYSAVLGGEGSLFFLYTTLMYGWTVVEYSYFETINTVVHLVGNIIAIPLFTKILNLNDMIITSIAFLDKILCNVIIAIFTTTVGLYAGIVVSLIIAIAPIAIRSYASKIVSENDLGKAQSLFAIVETVAPMISVPIYGSWVYVNTSETFRQAFLVLGMVALGFAIIVMTFMYYRDKRRAATIRNEIEMEATNGNAIVETTHI